LPSCLHLLSRPVGGAWNGTYGCIGGAAWSIEEEATALGRGVGACGGGMMEEAVLTAAGVGVASALTVSGNAPLVVLGFVGLLCGAGLAEGFAGDCLVVADDSCNDIVGTVAPFGGDIVFAVVGGSAAGAGLGLALAPNLNLIGAAFGGKLSFNFACGGCGGSSTLAFAAVHRSFQYV